MSVFRNLLMQTFGWIGKPSDWSDIRKDCPANSIALYAGENATNYAIENGRLTWANPNIYLRNMGSAQYDTPISLPAGQFDTTTDELEIKILQPSNTDNPPPYQGPMCLGIKDGIKGATFSRQFCRVNTVSYRGYSTEDTVHIIKMSGTNIFIDGVLQTSVGTISAPDNKSAARLFRANDGSFYGDIFYFIWKRNGVPIYNLVPVPQGLVIGNYTVPSNGMFDIVNQQFYANQGTGTFTYGKDSVTEYDNLGFTATCTGGYNVFIDEVQYGSTYASGSQCNITWSTSGITTGDNITTPSAMKAHKIWISPATEGNNITAFRCNRVADSGNEQQGILWAHFNISNVINLQNLFYTDQQYRNILIEAVTAKNNLMKVSDINNAFYHTDSLEYIAILDGQGSTIVASPFFAQSGIKNLTLKNMTINAGNVFYYATNLEKIKGNAVFNASSGMFAGCYNLQEFPNLNFQNSTNLNIFLTENNKLKDTVLDVTPATGLTKIGIYGTASHTTTGFKGLRVSNEAPFNNATPPQINVSYTGMDRQALVTLFNDLPTVSSGQIINITGTTGSEDLTAQDVTIALNKGWTVTGGPAFTEYYAYTDSENNSVYTTDSTVKEDVFVLDKATNTNYNTNGKGIYGGGGGARKIEINTVPNWSSLSTWAIYTAAKFNNFNHTQCIIGSANNNGTRLTTTGAYQSKLRLFPLDDDFSVDSTKSLSTNTWYYFKTYFTGTQYKVDVSLTGAFEGEEENYISFTTNTKLNTSSKTWIGNNSHNTSEFVEGDLNIAYTKLVLDGVTTYLGYMQTPSTFYNAQLEQLDPQPTFMQNYQIIGSLTNNNGVLSGFSADNKAQIARPSFDTITSMEFIIPITLPSSFSGTGSNVIIGNVSGNRDCPQLEVKPTNSNKIWLGFPSGDMASWKGIDGTTSLQNGSSYLVKIEVLNGNLTLYSSADNGTSWTTEGTLNVGNDLSWISPYATLGADISSSPSQCSIGLNGMSVTINGVTNTYYPQGLCIGSDLYERNPSGDLLG